jgi:CheY-like chemotaxis protein
VDKVEREEFEDQLRESLGYLHDPYRLRHSPLAARFGVANRHDTPSALRHILTEAIEALEPSSRTPDDSRAWRMYESLYYRYVEQFSQEEVAEQMGLSSRQVRREQAAALEALTYQLLNRFRLDADVPRGEAYRHVLPEDAVTEELAWLREGAAETPSDIAEILPAVVDLVRPLATQREVSLVTEPLNGALQAAVDPVVLRQILLHLLDLAIVQSPSPGRVRATAHRDGWDVVVRLHALAGAPRRESPGKLRQAEQLAGMCGCAVRMSTEGGEFVAEASVVGVAQIPVLVVDDNEGTLQLIQRYLQGTRYRPQEVRDAAEAVSAAVTRSPAIIVLDVMMPQVDGWEVLGRLREHPETRAIPVIVCTILAQRELALSLGAAGFLRKPFTRHALLEALSDQIA